MELNSTLMWIPRSPLPFKSRVAASLIDRWRARSWFGLNRDLLQATIPRKWLWTKWLENRRSNASISRTWSCYRLSDTSSPQCPAQRSKWLSSKSTRAIERTWADTIASEWLTRQTLASQTLSSIVTRSWQGTHRIETWPKTEPPQTCLRSRLRTTKPLVDRQPKVIGARLNFVAKSPDASKQAKIHQNRLLRKVVKQQEQRQRMTICAFNHRISTEATQEAEYHLRAVQMPLNSWIVKAWQQLPSWNRSEAKWSRALTWEN